MSLLKRNAEEFCKAYLALSHRDRAIVRVKLVKKYGEDKIREIIRAVEGCENAVLQELEPSDDLPEKYL